MVGDKSGTDKAQQVRQIREQISVSVMGQVARQLLSVSSSIADSEPTFASFAPPLFGPSGAIAPRRDPLEPPATRQRLPPPVAQFGDTVVVFGPPAPACLLPPRQPSAVAAGRPQAKPPHRLRSELGRVSAGPYPFAPPLLPDAAVVSQGPSPALGEQAARPSGEAPPQEDESMASQDGSQGARPPSPPPPLSADVVMSSQDSQGARPPFPAAAAECRRCYVVPGQ